MTILYNAINTSEEKEKKLLLYNVDWFISNLLDNNDK